MRPFGTCVLDLERAVSPERLVPDELHVFHRKLGAATLGLSRRVGLARLHEQARSLGDVVERAGERDTATAHRERSEPEREPHADVDAREVAREPFVIARTKPHVRQPHAAEPRPHAADLHRHPALARGPLGSRTHDRPEREAGSEQDREPRARRDHDLVLEPQAWLELPIPERELPVAESEDAFPHLALLYLLLVAK
jgi:hypothetical protein